MTAEASGSCILPNVSSSPDSPQTQTPLLHVINALSKSASHVWEQVSQYIVTKIQNPAVSAILTLAKQDYTRLQPVLTTFQDVTSVNGISKSHLPYVVLRDPPHTVPHTATFNALTHNLDLKFILKVNVGGVKTLAVLDSASSLSHIDHELLKSPKVQLKPKADVAAVIAATGSPMVIKGSVTTCWKLTNTGFSIPSETFNVIDIPYKGIGMIIGQDLLSKYKIDILNSTESVSMCYRGHRYSIPKTLLVPAAEAETSHKTEYSEPYSNPKQISRDLKKGGRIS